MWSVECSHTDITSLSLLSLTPGAIGKEKAERVYEPSVINICSSALFAGHDRTVIPINSQKLWLHAQNLQKTKPATVWVGNGLWSSTLCWGAICNRWLLGQNDLGFVFFFLFSEVKRKFGLYKEYNINAVGRTQLFSYWSHKIVNLKNK